MKPIVFLSTLPSGLRDPLLSEYKETAQNYCEGRWSPSELSGGKFCEVTYTILEGFAAGSYASTPRKPRDFVGACRGLEQHAHVPRSFQILIPRLLPAIYEVRNNRGVGHVSGDVDSNCMDATFVVNNCSWVLAELIRVYHNVSIEEAQSTVDSLVQRRIPLVWEGTDVRRVLNPSFSLRTQLLLLLATSPGPVSASELLLWTECKNKSYFRRRLREMHRERLVELSDNEECVEILPNGSKEAEEIVNTHS